MRGKEYPGKAIDTYKSHGTRIEGNFLGSLSNAEKASPYLQSDTIKMLDLLKSNQRALGISDDEGYYVSGWYATDKLTDTIFSNNFFCGNTLQRLYNPATNKDDIDRDYIIYIKQYDDIYIRTIFQAGRWMRMDV